jgi:hypothetical protein
MDRKESTWKMEIKGTDDPVLVCFGFWRIRKAALHYKIPQHLRQKGEDVSYTLYLIFRQTIQTLLHMMDRL